MNRIEKIFRILYKRNDFIQIHELADVLSVSKRTLHNDLNTLEHVLNQHAIKLIRKRGVGVMVTVADADVDAVVQDLSHGTLNTTHARRKEIVQMLIKGEEPISIKRLCSQFYISRGALAKDLIFLNEMLQEYHLSIENMHGVGLKLMGDEQHMRNFTSRFIQSNAQSSVRNEQLEKIIHDMGFNKRLIHIENILNSVEDELGLKFNDEAYVNLWIHIVIAIERNRIGRFVQLTESQKKDLLKKFTKEFEIAQRAVNRILLETNEKLPEDEVYYLMLHFISSKISMTGEYDFGFRINAKDQVLDDILKAFVKSVSIDLGVPLYKDQFLYNSLVLHLNPTINRLNYGFELENPYLNEIQRKYEDIYHCVKRHIGLIEGQLSVVFPETEIAYVVIHILGAIERLRSPVNVIIVCSSGIGISQLITENVRNIDSKIHVLATVSILELEYYLNDQVDLIISTIQADIDVKPEVIYVNNLLSIDEKKIIHDRVQEISKQKLMRAAPHPIQPHVIVSNAAYTSKEHMIRSVLGELLNHGYITEEFQKTLRNREQVGSTYIGWHTAIPHGNPIHVLKSIIYVVKNNTHIVWRGECEVDFVVFVMCSPESLGYFKAILGYFGKNLDNEAYWDKLKAMNKEMLEKEFELIVYEYN